MSLFDWIKPKRPSVIVLESDSLAIDQIGGKLKADLPIIDAQLQKIDEDLDEIEVAKGRLFQKRDKLESKRAMVVKIIEA